MTEASHPIVQADPADETSLSFPGWLLIGTVGVVLLVFLGWRWNEPLAAWLAPVFLIRAFRAPKSWTTTLLLVPFMIGALLLSMLGSWPLSTAYFIGVATLRFSVYGAALYADRALARDGSGILPTLVFPSALVFADFLLTGLPFGTIFSPAATQFSFPTLAQLASVTGIWGITFLTGWFASTANALWEQGFDARRVAKPLLAFGLTLVAVQLLGAVRLMPAAESIPTVRIGSVAVPHVRPYWDQIDAGNPPEGELELAAEIRGLEDELFLASERAVNGGAKIVFWSEGNAVLYAHDEARFFERARAFAREHDVYLAPGMLVLETGEHYGANKVALIDPEGEILFSYEKTKSPFTTKSDGVLPVADTPYGRITAAVCFDYDFPTFVNQLGTQNVDIALVPSFDTRAISPFHTEVALFRAIENGFAMVRHVNAGASMAVDRTGRVLAYQDFFATPDATMISDVPTKGAPTFYGRFGNWFAWVCGLLLLLTVGRALAARSTPA